jgi:hypothetical protein
MLGGVAGGVTMWVDKGVVHYEYNLLIDGIEAATAKLPYTPPLTFTASETFDVGRDLGSVVALDYHARAPFAFSGGSIRDVQVRYP